METFVGRTLEMNRVLGLMERTITGNGNHIVIESAPGLGRTALLARTADEATSRGMLVLWDRATRLDRTAGWSTLMRLFLHHPLLQDAPPAPGGASWQEFDLLLRIGRGLTEHARRQPVLITLDDAQWSDETTALLLPTLIRYTEGSSVLWLIGHGPLRSGDPTAEALSRLADDEHLLRLGPLSDEEVVSLYRETMGEPTRNHLRLLEKCVGVPSLVSQMLAALEQPHTADPTAIREVSDLPRSFHEKVVSRLDKLPPPARSLLQVNAILNRPFTLHEAARLLGSSPTELFPAADEAMDNGMLVVRDGRLEAADDLTRESVYTTMSPPTKHALHREAAAMLAEHASGATPESVHHLVACTETGQELVDHLSPALGRGDIGAHTLVDATNVLLGRGKPTEAREVVKAVLERVSSPDVLYTALAVLQDTSVQHTSFVDLGPHVERALRGVGPDSPVRAGLLAIRAGCLLEKGHPKEAVATLEEASALGLATDHMAAVGRAGAVRLRIAFGQGDLESIRTYTGDLPHPGTGPSDAARAYRTIRLVLAVTLAARDEFEEASSTIDLALWEEVAADSSATAFWAAHRALLLLWLGELDEAERICQHVDCGVDPSGNLVKDVRSVLGYVHLLRGEEHVARQYFHRLLAEERSPACPRYQETALGMALAGGGFPVVAELYTTLEENATLLLRRPEAAAHLVHLALRADHPQEAELVVRTSARLARDNPGVPSLEGAARHSAGLFADDLDLLRTATRAYSHSPRTLLRALAAEDTAGAAACQGETDLARSLFTEASGLYGRCGAVGPADRAARAAHRTAGTAENSPVPGFGGERAWRELSGSERRVALLVADGLTNREVADRLFLSPHTVDSHLRSSFRKLAVRNRVELARLVISRAS